MLQIQYCKQSNLGAAKLDIVAKSPWVTSLTWVYSGFGLCWCNKCDFHYLVLEQLLDMS